MKQNNLVEAISMFSNSIKMNHEYTDGYTNLGIALAKQQNFSETRCSSFLIVTKKT